MGLCITQTGYITAEVIRFAAVTAATVVKAAVAVEAFITHSENAIENFSKLNAISSRGLSIEEAEHGHLTGVYYPAENQFLAEFSQTTPWEAEAVLAKRYAGRMWAPLASAFAKQQATLECQKPRYCTTAFRKEVQTLLVARAAAKANVITLAGQIAFAEVESVRDRDFAQRQEAIAMRKGLVGQAASLLKSAAAGLAAAGADSLAGANNALQQLGALAGGSEFSNFDRGVANRVGVNRNQARASANASSTPLAGNIGNMNEENAYSSRGGEAGGGQGFLNLSSTPAVMSAGDANTTTGVSNGGQKEDYARGGGHTFYVNGRLISINMEAHDLVSVDNYNTAWTQTGPASLPGPATGGGPTAVGYLPDGQLG